MRTGLYIHIPFCNTKCDYCSFYSLPLNGNINRDIIHNYIAALLTEINLRADELKDYEVDTIYFGGGTPSLLQPADLDRILNHLYKRFNTGRICDEITIECNPGSFSPELIKEFKRLNINRVVLGVQTLNEYFHKLIGRAGDLCDTEILKRFAGIPEIIHCVDVIFGIPGQTWELLKSDLAVITDFNFEHISAYTLTIEEGTPIHCRKNQLLGIDKSFRNNFESTIEFLTDKGYIHYEVSNYAMTGFESKHNMKYWKFLPYAGLGAGAHSFYNNERYYNNSNVEDYIRNNGNIRQKDLRTEDSAAVEYILSGMRLSKGILLKEMERKIYRKIPTEMMDIINRMVKENLIKIEYTKEDINISFTREGFFRMDSLVYELTEIFL